MTVYELVLTIDKELLQLLHSRKYTRFSIFRDIEMYEFYMNERKTVGCMQSRTNTADKFFTSEETVQKALQRMKSNVKPN
jgi:hypothetical protein